MRRRERGEDDGIATKGEEGTNRQCLEGDVMPARRRQPENTSSGRVDPLPRWAGKRPPNLYAPEGQQSLPPTTKSKRQGFWKGFLSCLRHRRIVSSVVLFLFSSTKSS